MFLKVLLVSPRLSCYNHQKILSCYDYKLFFLYFYRLKGLYLMDKSKSGLLSTTRETLALLKFNFRILIFFEAIYTMIGSLVVYPVGIFLFNTIMSFLGFPYLSGANFTQALTNPLCLLNFLCFAVIFGFFALLELTTLILLFNESHFRRKIQLLPLVNEGFKRAITIVRPKNLLFLVFILVIIPLTEFSLSSNFISSISIPGFIMSYITANAFYSLGFLILSVILFLVAVYWIFSFHFFTLSGDNFFASVKKSVTLMKGHFWRSVLTILFWNVLIVLALVTVVIMLELITFFSLEQLINHPLGLAIFIGTFGFFVSSLFTFFQLIVSSMNLSIVSNFYYAYSQSSQLVVSADPLVTSNHPARLKKKTILAISIAVILFIVTLNSAVIFTSFNEIFNDHFLTGPDITAHRGASNLAPENTLAALQKAIDAGADYAEIDVAQTKDGAIVVSHDNNIKRISGQDLNIWSSNYADIKDLDIGSWFDPQFKNERIPTLEEAILLCQDKIRLNIELKPTGHEASLVESTVAIINANHFEDQCILASLDYPLLEKVATVDPQIKRAYITAVAIGNIQTLPVDGLSVEATFVTPDLVSNAHRADQEVYVWTVDSEELTMKMVKMGVDNLITDDVAQTQATINQMTAPRELIERINDFIFEDLVF